MVARRAIIGWFAAALAVGALVAPSASAQEGTVWLCEPFSTPNPCHDSLESTVYAEDGSSRVERPAFAKRPKFDCFYVYPTVSQQQGPNANRDIDPQQVAIAQYQAARYSQLCRVWAPVYRQLTLAALNGPPEQQAEALKVAYADVRSAWLDYLKNHNRGRGVVFIGHSQGTRMLRQLIRTEVDPKPEVRRRVISAILLGGNVTVRKGSDLGGDFQRIRACKRPTQARCVIAWSTFMDPPPPNSRYGRQPGSSGSTADPFGLPTGPDYEVLCNSAAALGGGHARLSSYLRSEPFPGLLGVLLIQMYGGPPPTAPTPWLQPQDHYTGECVTENDANVLKITPVGSARHMNFAPDPSWGLHLADANIALGNLVEVVDSQSRAWLTAEKKRKRKEARARARG